MPSQEAKSEDEVMVTRWEARLSQVEIQGLVGRACVSVLWGAAVCCAFTAGGACYSRSRKAAWQMTLKTDTHS